MATIPQNFSHFIELVKIHKQEPKECIEQVFLETQKVVQFDQVLVKIVRNADNSFYKIDCINFNLFGNPQITSDKKPDNGFRELDGYVSYLLKMMLDYLITSLHLKFEKDEITVYQNGKWIL
jgi:hypothetical protein